MTDNEIRVAIAEACGWTDIQMCPWGIMGRPDFARPRDCEQDEHGRFHLPNYVNDLNAMREAEAVVFNQKHWTTYTDLLIDLVAKDQSPIRATARQRAEAFLRTIGKWQDTSTNAP